MATRRQGEGARRFGRVCESRQFLSCSHPGWLWALVSNVGTPHVLLVRHGLARGFLRLRAAHSERLLSVGRCGRCLAPTAGSGSSIIVILHTHTRQWDRRA